MRCGSARGGACTAAALSVHSPARHDSATSATSAAAAGVGLEQELLTIKGHHL